MNNILSDKEVKKIKEKYPSGTRIKLLKDMAEEKYPLLAGSEGIVVFVDDIGTIHMKWDNGRTLGIVPDIDVFEVISTPDMEEEIEK